MIKGWLKCILVYTYISRLHYRYWYHKYIYDLRWLDYSIIFTLQSINITKTKGEG